MQTMMQAITQSASKAAKPVVIAMPEVTDPAEYSGRIITGSGPKASRPKLRQPPFILSPQDKYTDQKNFKMEVRNSS